MKFTIVPVALAAALASANPHLARGNPHGWMPAGPDDFRGPCPMMNTLANHGFLPRDGKDLTEPTVVKALGDGLNFDADLAKLMFKMAIIANPEPNATFFTLDHLNRHNVLEHDASLSRLDAAFGNNHVFDQATFDESRVYWTDDVIDAQQLANSKLIRQINSRASNPDYTFTANTENFSLGEVAAPVIVFGDLESATVEKKLVVYFFENERLPSSLGWTKKADPITLEQIGRMTSVIANATSLLTSSDSTQAVRLRDLHSGLGL